MADEVQLIEDPIEQAAFDRAEIVSLKARVLSLEDRVADLEREAGEVSGFEPGQIRAC